MVLVLPGFLLLCVMLWVDLRRLKRKIWETFKDDPNPPRSIWDERVQKQILGRDRGIFYRLLIGPDRRGQDQKSERPKNST